MTRVDMYVGWGRDRILSQILLAPVTHQPSCLLIILLLGKIYFVMVLVLVKWSMFCKYKVFNTTVCIFRCRQSSDQIQALQWSVIKSLIQVLISVQSLDYTILGAEEVLNRMMRRLWQKRAGSSSIIDQSNFLRSLIRTDRGVNWV